MDYSQRKKIENVARNKYEAVIVASKLARKLNSQRFASLEQLGAEAPIPTYMSKVTTEALNKLAEGKVKYIFKDDTEEEVFPE